MILVKHKRLWKILAVCALMLAFAFAPWMQQTVYAINFPDIGIIVGDDVDTDALGNSVTLQILFLTVLIALLPSLLVVMTSFTRLI
ncbi:MAG: hypothetical protein LBE55_07160, partial [Clostridiales bacterium]|nr:hypothetical protein [Clostridiales bacterium]